MPLQVSKAISTPLYISSLNILWNPARYNPFENALSELNESGLNHVCTTDTESRLMETRDGYKPSFNVQTAVEPNSHIIVDFDVTSHCADWGLLEAGIAGAKDVLGVETLEGIADKGYGKCSWLMGTI